jgi:hypothetical protein
MFLQKFDILINKHASPITNFNNEVTKLPTSDEITRIDGTLFRGAVSRMWVQLGQQEHQTLIFGTHIDNCHTWREKILDPTK